MKTDADWQSIAREEVRFFGRVSAAISHEINNRFAVINEKAGLLQDLAGMLAQGREVDPARIQLQSGKIAEQVRLAKRVVGNLNRFAHSVDIEHTQIDVAELTGFVATLYARKAEMADVRLTVTDSSESTTVTTSPFALETLIGRGIEIALLKTGTSGAVAIETLGTAEGVRLRYCGLEDVTEPVELPEGAEVGALLEGLGAAFSAEADGTALLLDIPDDRRSPHGRTA